MTFAATPYKPEAQARDNDSASADLALAELIEQLTERIARGESLDLEAFLVEHPTHADRLRPLVPALTTLANLSGSNPVGWEKAAAAAGPPSSPGDSVGQRSL